MASEWEALRQSRDPGVWLPGADSPSAWDVERAGLERHPTPTPAWLPSLRPYLAVLASVCPCPTSHLHSLPYKSRNVSFLSHSLID